MNLDQALGFIRNKWDRALEEHTAMEALLQAGEAAQAAENEAKAMLQGRAEVKADLERHQEAAKIEREEIAKALAEARAELEAVKAQAARVKEGQREQYSLAEFDQRKRLESIEFERNLALTEKRNLEKEIQDLKDQKAALEQIAQSMLKK